MGSNGDSSKPNQRRRRNGKKKNGGTKKNGTTADTKKALTIGDVVLDVGSSKNAANIDEMMDVIVGYIRTSDKFGNYRQEMADALVSGIPDAPSKPNPAAATYQVDASVTDPMVRAAAERLISIEYSSDHDEWMKRNRQYADNTRAVASLLWSKCTKTLQARIKNAETKSDLDTCAIKMKKAIKKHATSFRPNAHPLIQVIDAMKALVNIKQGDDQDVESYGKSLKSAAKVAMERLGTPIPVNTYVAEMDGYEESKYDDYVQLAFAELVAMIGVLGANDTKYKSYKEEQKNDFAKGNNNFPKTIQELKVQLSARRWDKNPAHIRSTLTAKQQQ